MPSPQISVRAIMNADDAVFDQVVQLGDLHRKTLGFMPRAAFEQMANEQTILVAETDNVLDGYLLYGLTGDRIRLIHLCVRRDARGRGIAEGLVNGLIDRYPERRGIRLRCRRDYGLQDFWNRLGFSPMSETSGRGKTRSALTIWWRDFGHPDLFTPAEDETRLIVVPDTNVFSDLVLMESRDGFEESLVLAADWLSEIAVVHTTRALKAELDRTANNTDRQRLLATAEGYAELPTMQAEVDELKSILIEETAEHRNNDESAEADAHLIASAIVAGADVYVTRDSAAIDRFAAVALEKGGLHVLRPSDIAIGVEYLVAGTATDARRLHESSIEIKPWPLGSEKTLEGLLNKPQGETKRDFANRMRNAASEISGGHSRCLFDAGTPVAAIATVHSENELTANVTRVAGTHRLSRTIANQIPLLLREEARARCCNSVRVADPYADSEVIDALTRDGFRRLGGNWHALVLQGQISYASLTAEVETALGDRISETEPSSDREWASLEHEYWPAKLTDAELPNFLIPIKPSFASQLFGSDQTLFDRDDRLALSREHAYYRAPKPQNLLAPARVIWYSSGPRMHAIAASQITNVLVDTPKLVYSRYRHLGVWSLDQVEGASKDDRVSIVVFRDTELFERPVPLERLREIDAELEPRVWPSRISSSSFMQVYSEGFSR